jgi:2-polyprenyl-3-methyl-5-hydroxy-6-metoxy-1,4-benzoquinol methylase
MATRSQVLTSELKEQIREFWQQSPCDSWFSDHQWGASEFYKSLDEHRYKVHRGLLSALEAEKTRGLRVLEVGCGCGSEAERFARAGARYTGVDLTDMAVRLSRKRFQLAGLEGRFLQGDAEDLPFTDDSFEFVRPTAYATKPSAPTS